MGGEATPEQVKELQKARQVFEEVRPYGSLDAEAAYKKDRNLSARRLAAGSTAPSAPSSSKPNCASIRAAALTVLWSAGRSSTRPASASIRRATCPAAGPRARRWATWREASNAIRNSNPSSPTASGSSASRLNQVAGSAWSWLSPMASTSVEAAAWEFDLSCFPPSERHSTTICKMRLRECSCCPVWSQQPSETASKRQSLDRRVPSRGVRSASQMQFDEVCGRLLLMTVNRTGVRP